MKHILFQYDVSLNSSLIHVCTLGDLGILYLKFNRYLDAAEVDAESTLDGPTMVTQGQSGNFIMDGVLVHFYVVYIHPLKPHLS